MSCAKASVGPARGRCGLNFAALACHRMSHAELSRTSRALAPFPSSPASTPHARLRARQALAQPPLWRLSVATDEERNIVKARDSRRPGGRRTPEELGQDHEDALRWRAKLRAGAAGPISEIAKPPAAVSPARSGSERSRFAAAIARAEFGRFYFKPMRPGRSPKPARGRNGKADCIRKLDSGRSVSV
jgi:hypothetical protein